VAVLAYELLDTRRASIEPPTPPNVVPGANVRGRTAAVLHTGAPGITDIDVRTAGVSEIPLPFGPLEGGDAIGVGDVLGGMATGPGAEIGDPAGNVIYCGWPYTCAPWYIDCRLAHPQSTPQQAHKRPAANNFCVMVASVRDGWGSCGGDKANRQK
jgi:hypothetical protein